MTSTIFWPVGWSRERLVHATGDEIGTLSPEDSDRMFDSLRTSLGPDGYKVLVQEMEANETARQQQEAEVAGHSANWLDQLTPEQRVPLLQTLRQRCPNGPYGWVIYRTCCYEDEARWQSFRAKWDAFIASQFEPDIDVPGVKEALSRYELRWTEDKQFANADIAQISAHYRALEDSLPQGLQLGMCLSVGEQEVSSVLDSPNPTPTPIHEQTMIPYVLGIDKWAGFDTAKDLEDAYEHNWRTSYKIALTALTGDFLGIMLRTSRSPREMSVGLRENKIWLNSAGRFGIFTIGKSGQE